MQSSGSSRPSLTLSKDRVRASLSTSYTVAQVVATSTTIHGESAPGLFLERVRASLSVPCTQVRVGHHWKLLNREGQAVVKGREAVPNLARSDWSLLACCALLG